MRSWFGETPGCFVVRDALGQLLLKALPKLRFVDAQQRQLAAAQRMDGQWKLEVQGADLGLAPRKSLKKSIKKEKKKTIKRNMEIAGLRLLLGS